MLIEVIITTIGGLVQQTGLCVHGHCCSCQNGLEAAYTSKTKLYVELNLTCLAA
jgi:hypothetical protein